MYPSVDDKIQISHQDAKTVETCAESTMPSVRNAMVSISTANNSGQNRNF